MRRIITRLVQIRLEAKKREFQVMTFQRQIYFGCADIGCGTSNVHGYSGSPSKGGEEDDDQ
jgi:hypothetical protein